MDKGFMKKFVLKYMSNFAWFPPFVQAAANLQRGLATIETLF